MLENGTASCNAGQTVPVHKEERSVSENVTEDKDVTTLTTVPTKNDNSSATAEYRSGEDVTQDAQEGLRLTISMDETGGNKQHQKKQAFQ